MGAFQKVLVPPEIGRAERTAPIAGVVPVGYECAVNGRAWVSPLPRNQVPIDWYEYNGYSSGSFSTNASDPAGIAAPQFEYRPETGDISIAGVSYQGVGSDSESAFFDGMFKQRNDNSRYTLYAKDVNFYTQHQTNIPNDTDAATNLVMPAGVLSKTYENPYSFDIDQTKYDEEQQYYPYASRDDFSQRSTSMVSGGNITSDREPSLSGYAKYTEIKNLKVDAGFNAPSNVAQTLTDQLNQTEGLTPKYGWSGLWIDQKGDPNSLQATDMNEHQRQAIISTQNDCETYKAFSCSNFDSFSEDNWTGYMDNDNLPVEGSDDSSVNHAGVVNHLSSYQYVGIKRPDLFEAYRGFYENQVKPVAQGGDGYSWRDIHHASVVASIAGPKFLHGSGDTAETLVKPIESDVITNIPWTDENLLRFKTVFDVEGNHPELFTGYNVSDVDTDVSRPKVTIYVQVGANPAAQRWKQPSYNSGNWNTYVAGDADKVFQYHLTVDASAVGSDMDIEIDIVAPATTWPAPAVNPAAYLFGWIGVCYGWQAKWTVVAPDFTCLPRPWLMYGGDSHAVGGNFALGGYVDGVNLGSGVQPTTLKANISEFRGKGCSPDHMRFVHMNPYNGWRSVCQSLTGFVTGNDVGVELGCDNCLSDPLALNQNFWDQSSCPLFIYFDKTRKEVSTGGENSDRLVYGCMKKTLYGGVHYITFTTKRIGGIPRFWFIERPRGAPVVPYWEPVFGNINSRANTGIIENRSIGFDLHFNAYGTSAIMLYSGILNANKDKSEEYSVVSVGEGFQNTTFEATKKNATNSPLWPTNIAKWIRQRYVGANSPLVSFDADGERFNFQQLHTPLYTGNSWNAGQTAVQAHIGGAPVVGSQPPIPEVADAGDPAILINRRFNGNEFTPEMMPYSPPMLETIEGLEPQEITTFNTNLFPWTPYDSDGGVFLEDFGVLEKDWEKSFWGVLGFSYLQFHPTSQSTDRQTRINNIVEVSQIAKPTTNANITAADMVAIRTNALGASLFTNQLPPASMVMGTYSEFTGTPVSATAPPFATNPWYYKTINQVNYPPINIKQTSAQINAEKLPRKMLNAFYLVKSNIIGDVGYLGGPDSGQALPIVGLVNKENGFGDFYFGQGGVEFTATQSRVISEVTTSIHQPNMELARVSADSAVIYSVKKINNASLNVVQEILKSKKNLPKPTNLNPNL